MICFYCGNPINADGRYVAASIAHWYKSGATRMSARDFHEPCFAKFEARGGRPWNPETRYEVLEAERMNA